MINYTFGDIFSSPCMTIVNPVNTVGVMGKGLALQFKERYPKIMDNYTARCKDGSFTVGKLLMYTASSDGRNILLFPTKKDWREPSKLEYIEAALDKLVGNLGKLKKDENGIVTIAFPPVGCGLGGLNWSDVRKLFEVRFSLRQDVIITVHLPGNN